MIHSFRLLHIFAFVGYALITTTVFANPKNSKPLLQMSLELVKGLDVSSRQPKNCDRMGSSLPFREKICANRKKARIAIRPFQQDEIPLSKEVANEFNDRLLTYLINQTEGRYEFIAREELLAITSEIFEFSNTRNPINALLKQVADIDVLISESSTP